MSVTTWSDIKNICSGHPLFLDASHWLTPLLRGADSWPSMADLNQAARVTAPDFRWNFVLSEKVPRRAKSRGMSSLSGYIELIANQNKIPVRGENAHDFFNALSFMMFPKSKLVLNQRHLMESPFGIKKGQNRTRTQDLLTIFDEGGVLRLIGSSGATKDFIFGHAVYEHIIYGKELRAARLDLVTDDYFFSRSILDMTSAADDMFAAWLARPDHCRSGDEFSFLQVRP